MRIILCSIFSIFWISHPSMTDSNHIWSGLHPSFELCYSKVLDEISETTDINLLEKDSLSQLIATIEFQVYFMDSVLPADSTLFLGILIPEFGSQPKKRLFRQNRKATKMKKNRICNCAVLLNPSGAIVIAHSSERKNEPLRIGESALLTRGKGITPVAYPEGSSIGETLRSNKMNLLLYLNSGWNYQVIVYGPNQFDIFYNDRCENHSDYVKISYTRFLAHHKDDNMNRAKSDFNNPSKKTFHLLEY